MNTLLLIRMAMPWRQPFKILTRMTASSFDLYITLLTVTLWKGWGNNCIVTGLLYEQIMGVYIRKSIWRKTLPNQTCQSTRCGDPLWVTEQLKVAVFSPCEQTPIVHLLLINYLMRCWVWNDWQMFDLRVLFLSPWAITTDICHLLLGKKSEL